MCFIVCSSFLLHSHPAPQGDPPAGGGGEGQEEGGEGGGGQGQEHLVPGQYLVPINLTPLFSTFLSTSFYPSVQWYLLLQVVKKPFLFLYCIMLESVDHLDRRFSGPRFLLFYAVNQMWCLIRPSRSKKDEEVRGVGAAHAWVIVSGPRPPDFLKWCLLYVCGGAISNKKLNKLAMLS